MLGRNFRRAAPPATAKQPNAATCWWANALSAPPGYIRPTIYHAPRGPAAALRELRVSLPTTELTFPATTQNPPQ